MKITIDDPFVGEREVGPLASDLIRDQLAVLCSFRDDGRIPSKLLLDDIAAYKFILAQPDPEELCEKYFRAKRELMEKHNCWTYTVSRVFDEMGWPFRRENQ